MTLITTGIVALLICSLCSHSKCTTVTTSKEDIVEETQHAMCKIISQEIETSANATITRQLKGICTNKQMEKVFQRLEERLLIELNKIKLLLGLNESTNQTFLKPPTPSTTTKPDYDYYSNFEDQNLGAINEEQQNVERISRKQSEDLMSLKHTRDAEIASFNNTLLKINKENIYQYYWRIENAKELLQKQEIHIRSPDLFVLGHQLCLQLFPNHQGSNYVAIQLRPTTNFMKKHNLAILDWTTDSNDLISSMLGGIDDLEMMYKVPNKIFEYKNYILNDVITVKLTLYLDS